MIAGGTNAGGEATPRKILGYRPIYEPAPGAIATQAFVLCSSCGAAIASVGGPLTDARCMACISLCSPSLLAAAECVVKADDDQVLTQTHLDVLRGACAAVRKQQVQS